MIRRNRIIARAFGSLGLAVLLFVLAVVPASAAPSLDVEIERDAALFPVVSHSDERVDYTVEVSNTAPTLPPGAPSVGDKMLCDGAAFPLGTRSWFREDTMNYSFEFQWVRNGEPITGWIPGVAGRTYTVQAADEEKALQCLVKGINGAKSASYLVSSQPVAVVDPQPAVEPPKPNDPTSAERRPPIDGSAKTAGEELTCTAPTTWSGSPSWTFEWLHNGVAATAGEVTETTATTSKFKIAGAELATKAVFQCMATAANAGGKAMVESERVKTEAPAPEFVELTEDDVPAANGVPVVERAGNTIVSAVTLEVELPGGEETRAFKIVDPLSQFQPLHVSKPPKGWACDQIPAVGTEHARAICTSPQLVRAGDSYPPLMIVTKLGPDAPDLAIAKATVFGAGAPTSASDEPPPLTIAPAIPFGLTEFETGLFDDEGNDFTQAGGHPLIAEGRFAFPWKRKLAPLVAGGAPGESARIAPVEAPKQLITEIPRGVVGNALAVPELCPGVDSVLSLKCPPGSMVGTINAIISNNPGVVSPIYAIEPEFGTPAQFSFVDPNGSSYTLSARLRPDDGYAVSIVSSPAAKTVDLLGAVATLCDFGVKKVGSSFACKKADEPGANPKPLFTNRGRCGAPDPVTRVRLNSWENPVFKEFSFKNVGVTGCEKVDFEPQMSLEPSSHQADSPTGLDIELTMPTEGLEDPDGIAQANLKRATVTFPEGMAVNASAGHGLGSCSASQVKLGTNDPISCPDSSKVGTVEIDTPLIEDNLEGAVYIAKQGDVEGSLIGLYLVFDSPENGLLIKMPAKVTPDPQTGQLVTVVDDSPEAPFSAVRMHFPAGPRATLLNPPKCGTYELKAELTPWSAKDPENPTAAETITQTSTYNVTQGPNGGPCPTGALDPKLSAGTESPVAGKTSPFIFRLSRDDGSQRFSGLSLTTPKGLTAYLKGVPYCPDAVLAGISGDAGTGQAQVDSPSCPSASQVGTAIAGAGAGPAPLFVDTGRAYLAGPYKGAPLSIAVVAPAVAGPLDLGNVVVRNALRINPETAQVSVISDPIPTILHGILLDIRDIRVAIDRPDFTLNPTNCEPMSVSAEVKGENGASASLSNRFQVGGCESLAFKPKLDLRLFGATKRGGHPRFRGVVQAAPGEANIGRAAVTIPRSEFLDQAHIRTICTRVQFAAKQCPKGSIYGQAEATTPLLDYPVEGPVYLRSSNHKLPDLVVALKGPDYQPIEAVVVGRVDSIKGQIRTTFENAPDVPLTKFTLSMQGGEKGLLINSRDVCAATYKATAKLSGQNGKAFNSRPALKNGKCAKERKLKRHRKRATR